MRCPWQEFAKEEACVIRYIARRMRTQTGANLRNGGARRGIFFNFLTMPSDYDRLIMDGSRSIAV